MKYKRILLKLSGEALAGNQKHGYNLEVFKFITNEIKKIISNKVEVALVVGAGNIYRGKESKDLNIETTTGHYMGMLGTAMNALALESFFNNNGLKAKSLSMLSLDNVIQKYSKSKADSYLKEGNIVIFACGTGSPYFTTDTGASLKAVEIEADVMIKGTSVDGVYDKDPKKYDDAKFFETITFNDVLQKDLKVIDSTAISMCRDNKMPLIIYNMNKEDNLLKILQGEKIGTIVEP